MVTTCRPMPAELMKILNDQWIINLRETLKEVDMDMDANFEEIWNKIWEKGVEVGEAKGKLLDIVTEMMVYYEELDSECEHRKFLDEISTKIHVIVRDL